MNLPTFGNEGDDWIEIGTSDGAGGDNFDPQEASTIIGHDVFITGGGFDEVDGEGGDDIMVGSDGEDHFGGGGGFDWASYKFDQLGVTVDLNVNDLHRAAGHALGIGHPRSLRPGGRPVGLGVQRRPARRRCRRWPRSMSPAPRTARSPTSASSPVCRSCSAPA